MTFRSYLGVLLFCALVFGAGTILFCTWLLRSSVLLRLAGGAYEAVLMHHVSYVPQSGEVMVVGDSGAMSSISPEIVSREIGVPVVDFGLYGYSGWKSYRLMLNRYFASGAHPREVVIALAAASPLFLASPDTRYEKLIAVGVFGGWVDTLEELLRNPNGPSTVLFQFARFLAGYLRSPDRRSAFAARLDALKRARGFMPVEQMAPQAAKRRLPADCHIDSRQYSPGPAALGGLKDLRAYIQSKGVPVRVYIEPLPQCDAALASFSDLYDGVADNRLTALPSQLFANTTHLRSDGVRILSLQFAGFTRSSLADSGPKLSRAR